MAGTKVGVRVVCCIKTRCSARFIDKVHRFRCLSILLINKLFRSCLQKS